MAIAVITGESSGIGQAVTRQLQEAGLSVYGMSRTSGVDITDAKAVEAHYDQIGSPPPQILVASAGILVPQTFPYVEYDNWREVLDTNVTGVFIAVQEHARRLIHAKMPGKIVLVSSTSGRLPSMDNIAYGVSKAAVTALGLGLAQGLAAHGIQVYVVCTSHVDTPMFRKRDLTNVADGSVMSADSLAAEIVYLILTDNTLDGQALYMTRLITEKRR